MWYDRNFSPHIGSAHSDGGTHPSEGFYERGDGKSFDRRRRADDVGATGIIPTALADIKAALIDRALAAALANIEAAFVCCTLVAVGATEILVERAVETSVARVAPRVDGERAR